MTVARNQLRAPMLDYGECTKSIPLDFEDEVRMIESRLPPAQWHWLELHSGYCKRVLVSSYAVGRVSPFSRTRDKRGYDCKRP